MARNISLIVIHCAATPSGKPLQIGTPGASGFKNAAQRIDEWHAARGFKRGWAARQAFNPSLSSIGYHFVVETTGEVFTGRAEDETGAHVQGFNLASIGICLVGGTERDARYTHKQWASLSQLVRWQAEKHQVPVAFARNNKTGICGHRDLSPDLNGDGTIQPREWIKTCPGFDVESWLQRGMLPELKNLFGSAA